MENYLYLECETGISGDMMAAALLDLGADREILKKALDSLNVDGFSVEISRVKKSGLDVCDFDVKLDAAHENHDHDMEYLYGGRQGHEHVHDHGHPHDHGHDDHDHPHSHDHDHPHEHSHEHDHDHVHPHDHELEHFHEHDHSHPHDHDHEHSHDHPHTHRGLGEILDIIHGADMTDGAKATAERIFRILAEAEARAHGMSPEEVHFHEVGAVDSIVDIVTVAVCLDNLGITRAAVPRLYEGSGTVRCQHGIIPVPVPAVTNIAQAHGLKLKFTEMQGELITPTGAAIVAAIRTEEKLPEEFVIQKVGMGAGKRKYERPSILRAMLIRDTEKKTDRICKLETNIDDCTGEMLGYVMDRLLEAGARDVHYTPVYMKKNRPAWQLNVICSPEDVEKMEQIIFAETTTIGIRRIGMERTVLPRKEIHVQTSLGEAAVKVCSLEKEDRYYPEYDDVAKLAGEHGLSFGEVYELVKRESGNR